MKTFLVYQYNAYREVYHLVARVADLDPGRAAARAKIANCIVGCLYVAEAARRQVARDIPAGSDEARNLKSY